MGTAIQFTSGPVFTTGWGLFVVWKDDHRNPRIVARKSQRKNSQLLCMGTGRTPRSVYFHFVIAAVPQSGPVEFRILPCAQLREDPQLVLEWEPQLRHQPFMTSNDLVLFYAEEGQISACRAEVVADHTHRVELRSLDGATFDQDVPIVAIALL